MTARLYTRDGQLLGKALVGDRVAERTTFRMRGRQGLAQHYFGRGRREVLLELDGGQRVAGRIVGTRWEDGRRVWYLRGA